MNDTAPIDATPKVGHPILPQTRTQLERDALRRVQAAQERAKVLLSMLSPGRVLSESALKDIIEDQRIATLSLSTAIELGSRT